MAGNKDITWIWHSQILRGRNRTTFGRHSPVKYYELNLWYWTFWSFFMKKADLAKKNSCSFWLDMPRFNMFSFGDSIWAPKRFIMNRGCSQGEAITLRINEILAAPLIMKRENLFECDYQRISPLPHEFIHLEFHFEEQQIQAWFLLVVLSSIQCIESLQLWQLRSWILRIRIASNKLAVVFVAMKIDVAAIGKWTLRLYSS